MSQHIDNVAQSDSERQGNSYDQNQDKTYSARLILADGKNNQVSLDN